MPTVAIRAPRAIVQGREMAVTVVVADGHIAGVHPMTSQVHCDTEVVLGHDEVLMPGLVDTHVHVNEPGRTHWEGFATATAAAAAGGVTTIIDMPLNSVPATTTATALAVKRAAATPQAFVDVGFWGGAVPGNLPDLAPLHDDGVFGFKCFLLDSGVDEFPPVDRRELELAMVETARLGARLIVHAEDSQAIEPGPVGTRYASFLASRPCVAEDRAIGLVIELARRTGAAAHILHLSSADALPAIRAAREEGVPLTVETCPHYLALCAEEIPDGAAAFKCCPPVREAANRDRLWAALRDGTIDIVVTDHSPCPPELKGAAPADLGVAWGGISSLQLGLSVTWTTARARGHTLADVVRWMCTAPADLVGLADRGRIEPGARADFAVVAPDERFVVDPSLLRHRHPVSAYAGQTLQGVVRQTWLAGTPIDLDAAPRGALIRRSGS